MSIAALVELNIAPLRRYSRALLGDSVLGDHYVEQVLITLMERQEAPGSKVELFAELDAHLRTVTQSDNASRRALLLTAMEEFSLEEAGRIMGDSTQKLKHLLGEAERELVDQLRARLIIIEDEPLIAAHLKEIADSIGHQVVGMATTKTDALKVYTETKPELILSDVRLADDSLGTDAVVEMDLPEDVPVIFITAYPEQALAKEGSGPTYLIAKPFNVEYLKAVISQALMNVRTKKG